MSIDWAAFSPGPAVIGGALIGLSAALLLLLNGRIAGVSSILGGLLRVGRDAAWRAAFILGLVVAPMLWAVAAPLPEIRIEAGVPALTVAGLLVGLGTGYASGCTSGHGVCGLSRLSPRSLVATLAFMASGFATVFVMRHLIGI